MLVTIWHPLSSWRQQYTRLPTDHPVSQLAKPVEQSYGRERPVPPSEVVVGDGGGGGGGAGGVGVGPGEVVILVSSQPRFLRAQHHCFFLSDQPASQLLKPALQSKGSEPEAGVVSKRHPRPNLRQHQSFLRSDHLLCHSAYPSSQ